jgi:hypothetical protein
VENKSHSMKPCPKFKKQIALLAANSLSGDGSRQVQDHVRHCPGCREYRDAVSRICGEHFELAAELPVIEPDQRFHQRLTARIRADEAVEKSRPAIWKILHEGRPWPRWKLAFGAGVALVALAAWLVSRSAQKVEAPVVSSAPPRVPADVAGNFAPQPTLMAYRLAASKSFEALDALLAKDADRFLPATPFLTASARRELSLDE